MAIEKIVHLDNEHDRQLSLMDRLGSLDRFGHDPEPAVALAAVLPIEPGLESRGCLQSQIDFGIDNVQSILDKRVLLLQSASLVTASMTIQPQTA